jgi:DNA repair exonuclease SbcCD nuclease subunit
MKKLAKGAYMTDIHFGKKNNSEQHNQDCINYIDWFIKTVKEEGGVDYIGFLGDWHENRSAINVLTLAYSYAGAEKLNNFGLPVFFVVGNHDLYNKTSRDIHSVVHFKQFRNFHVIDQPEVITDIHDKMMFCPYMFQHEYPDLAKYADIPFWAGHFEFKGFILTGSNYTNPHGSDCRDFSGPKHIASGHFHKRQRGFNVTYIGNCFPMDFGDAGDDERGCMVYDHTTHNMHFYNWEQCPKYRKVNLSDIIDNKAPFIDGARIKCIADVAITYEEMTTLKQTITDTFNLRELVFEEPKETADAIVDTNADVDHLENIDDTFVKLVGELNVDKIDTQFLIELYKELKIEQL